MFVRQYHYLKAHLDKLKENRATGQVSTWRYIILLILFRFIIQLIVTPHFLLLGPFKTFVAFARKDESGSWIDSYNDFIISNKISLWGILALILIGIIAVIVFIYLPVFYIERPKQS